MPIGPYEEKELMQKLSNVPLEEMENYHTQRIKKYRLFTRLAFLCGVLSIGLWFVKPWLTALFGITGFIIITLTSFAKNRWLQLYENFRYYKKKGEKHQKESEVVKKSQGGQKYNQNKKTKTNPNTLKK